MYIFTDKLKHSIFNVRAFTSPRELFEEMDCNLTEEQTKFFDHVCDFEPILFVVVNNETVYTCDSINGDVQTVEDVEDFYKHSMELYGDED